MTVTPTRIIEGPPPLENGDRLSLEEFERRYEAMPPETKAQLIEGVVYLSSPARRIHANPHGILTAWLGSYSVDHPGTEVAVEGTVRLDEDNEPQPDVSLRRTEGGSSSGSEEGYVVGPPELVAEIAASSVSIDTHAKLRAYERNGVQEYIVWRVLDEQLDWFALREGRYERIEPDALGVTRSGVFPRLRLAVERLLADDYAAVLAEQSRQTS